MQLGAWRRAAFAFRVAHRKPCREHPFCDRGTCEGINIFVDDCGPTLLKPLKLDCLKRVTRIEMKCRNNPKILETAAELSSLKDICVM
jgi:hypothetical protein